MSYPNISSELLRTFIAVVEYDGFIRASEKLHKTQSTVSQQIRKLESEVGVSLFQAQGRKRQLTSAGEMFLGYARRILALQDDALSSLQFTHAVNEIRIGVSQGVADEVLPEVLASFCRSHPCARINVETGYSPDLNAAYDRGEFDLVLTLSLSELDGRGELLKLEPLAWIGAEAWEWGGHRELPLAMINGQCQFRQAGLAALDSAEVSRKVVYTSSSFQGVMAAVRSGLAVTPRPQSAASAGTELVGERLGLPALPNVFCWLRCQPGLNSAEVLADMLRAVSVTVR